MTRESNRSESGPGRDARYASTSVLTLGSALALTLLASTTSCAARTLRFDTAESAGQDDPRRAPGVAVDPQPELPTVRAVAEVSDGLATLAAPPSTEVARHTVRRFFELVLRGDYPALEPLIDENAWFNGGPGGGRQRARSFWQARLTRIDYGSVSLPALYRETDVETYRAEDLAALRPARSLGTSVTGNDVLVRVPITAPRVGRTRVFGDEVVFVLRPVGTEFVVTELVEDFQFQ